MASKIAIANFALAKLGVSRIISFLDDSKQARAMNVVFDMIRDAELREHIWKFSVTRASLPSLVSTPVNGYSYSYQLPSDCVRLLLIGDAVPTDSGISDLRSTGQPAWAIEGNVINCNYSAPIYIKYCARIEDTERYDAMFVDVLACRLGMELADELTDSSSKFEKLSSQYKRSVLAAVRANAMESPPVYPADDTWVSART